MDGFHITCCWNMLGVAVPGAAWMASPTSPHTPLPESGKLGVWEPVADTILYSKPA